MHQNDWKEIRWNEAVEMFDQLVQLVKDYDEQDYLSYTVMIISERLASRTWAEPIN